MRASLLLGGASREVWHFCSWQAQPLVPPRRWRVVAREVSLAVEVDRIGRPSPATQEGVERTASAAVAAVAAPV